MMERLSDDVIDSLRAAAACLSGFERRRFQAHIAQQWCAGNARQAEAVLGWGRAAVETGLNELRTGIRCLNMTHTHGRKRAEVKSPRLVDDVRKLVDPQSQADPKFQTTLAFTRATAVAVREALLAQEPTRQDVPCVSAVGRMLNRLGYRLSKVLKAKPLKKSLKRTPSLHTSARHAPEPRQTPPA